MSATGGSALKRLERLNQAPQCVHFPPLCFVVNDVEVHVIQDHVLPHAGTVGGYEPPPQLKTPKPQGKSKSKFKAAYALLLVAAVTIMSMHWRAPNLHAGSRHTVTVTLAG
eukprot:3600886-Pyramimonas_sp.AAC.1